MTNENTIELIKKYRELKEDSILNELILAHQGLVVSEAKKYSNNPFVQQEDLIQEGNIALNNSITKFDWNKGTKFSTFAVTNIRYAMLEFVEKYSQSIKVPLEIRRKHDEIKRITKEYIEKYNCYPDDETVSRLTNDKLDRQEIRKICIWCQKIYSMDQDSFLMDSNNLINTNDPSKIESEKEKIKVMKEALDSLTDEEKEILRVIDVKDIKNYAADKGISVSRVYQLGKEAKQKALDYYQKKLNI